MRGFLKQREGYKSAVLKVYRKFLEERKVTFYDDRICLNKVIFYSK